MTILYQDNFDSDTVGSIAPGWTNETGTWTVKASGATSGANSFSPSTVDSGSSGAFAVNTSGGTTADGTFQIDFTISSTSATSEFGAAMRLSGVGGNGYLANPYLVSGSIYLQLFKKTGSGYTQIGSTSSGVAYSNGDVAHIEIRCVGSTIEGRLWTNSTARPSSPSTSSTDTTYTAAGYSGIYFGSTTSGATNIGADNALLQNSAVTVAGSDAGGSVGAAYSTTFTASGGTAPYTYSVGSGSLPSGMALNTSTGVVSGTPTTAASYTYVIHAVDSTSGTALTGNSSTQNPTITSAPTTTTIARNNAALNYSPSNWYDDGTSAIAVNTGAYVSFTFTGTSLTLNTTAISLSAAYPRIRCFIDDQIYEFSLTSGTSYAIATGLASGSHTCQLHLDASLYSSGSWWSGANALKIVSFVLDASCTVSAPTIRSKIGFFFGDSLTQGYFVNGTTSPTNDDSLATYVPAVAKALDCEYAQVGWGGSNYNAAGVSSVPAFNTSYASIYSGVSRLTAGLFTVQPNYIFVMLGTNGTTAQSDVATAIAQLRAAAPKAAIFLIVPGGGYGRSSITAAVTASGDARVKLIDAGTAYQYASGTPNGYSADGTHYRPNYNQLLVAKWLAQIEDVIDTPYGQALGTASTIGVANLSVSAAGVSGVCGSVFTKTAAGSPGKKLFSFGRANDDSTSTITIGAATAGSCAATISIPSGIGGINAGDSLLAYLETDPEATGSHTEICAATAA